MKVAVNPPVELATTLAGEVTIEVPSKLTVMTKFGAKFEPCTDTVVPDGPFVGFVVRVDEMTVNVADE